MTFPASAQGAGIQVYFPTAVSEHLNPGFNAFDIERITLQLQPLDGQNNVAVARALASKTSMTVTESGLLVTPHLPTKPLPRSVERRIRRIAPVTATIEIRRTLGATHPLVFCLNPRIDTSEQGYIPHVYIARHPTEGVNALCTYPPHYMLFDPQSLEGQYHLVHSISTWLANYLIWKATRTWVGPEASHSQAVIQTQFGRNDCWCRSGRPMAQCHGTPLSRSTS
ncbi:hypothetical protein GCM10017784_11020 [Deinococcus indicus]|nr:hypothetical protein GCM10017784_11020 [Deinococcus indicus]